MRRPTLRPWARSALLASGTLAFVVVLLMRFIRVDIDSGISSPATSKRTTNEAGPAQKRLFAKDSMWQVLWVAGRGENVGIFAEPRQLVVNGNKVIVLDAGTREVRVLDLSSGSVEFTKSATGGGPGEFKRPALLTHSPIGFAVLDHASGRLSNFSLAGELTWDFVIPSVFELAGICIPDNETVVVQYNWIRNNVVHFDTSGRRLATQSTPWSNMERDAVQVGLTGFMSNSVRLGGCAFAPLYGREWVYQPASTTGGARAYPYVEPGEDPVFRTTERILARDGKTVDLELDQRTDATVVAQGIQAVGDTVVINAWGTTRPIGRILDYHHLPSGRYLYSRVLPFVVNGFAIAPDGTFIVSHIGDTEQIVMAMRPVARPDSTTKSGQARTTTATPRANMPARPSAPARVPPRASR